jgi:hypothetical protein
MRVNFINPDKPEKWPPRHKDTKQNCLKKLIFVFWCPGGENIFAQNVVNPPLEGKEFTIKVLSFFRDCARKKWPLRGSRCTEHLTEHVTGFSTMSLV